MVRILGDIHGDCNSVLDFIYSKDKYCIQLGDFGFIFANRETDYERNQIEYMNNKLEENDKWFFTVLGNHDCWPRYYLMEEVNIFGAKCWKLANRIYAIQPGEILVLENKTYLCIGGADSHDKAWRLNYEEEHSEKIWWKEEAIEIKDIENAYKNLKNYNGEIDYICTHTPPEAMMYVYFRGSSYGYNEYSDTGNSALKLNHILEEVDFKYWYCGHMHSCCSHSFGYKTVSILGIDDCIQI